MVSFRRAEDSPAGALPPVQVDWEGSTISIPLRFGAIAAEPYTGVVVMIAADRPWRPANYATLAIDPTLVVVDGSRSTNYDPQLARRAAELEGRAFFTEYLGPSSSARTPLNLPPVLSRFSTRISPWHMTLDPVFEPDPEAEPVPAGGPDPEVLHPARIDLSSQPALMQCGRPLAGQTAGPCGRNYCGPGAQCFETAPGAAACACPAGTAARNLGFDRGFAVTCVPVEPSAAPCETSACGLGRCVRAGDDFTCLCDPGTVAQQSRSFAVPTCIPLPDALEARGPGAGVEALPAGRLRALAARVPRPAGLSAPLLVLALLGLASVARRRDR